MSEELSDDDLETIKTILKDIANNIKRLHDAKVEFDAVDDLKQFITDFLQVSQLPDEVLENIQSTY